MFDAGAWKRTAVVHTFAWPPLYHQLRAKFTLLFLEEDSRTSRSAHKHGVPLHISNQLSLRAKSRIISKADGPHDLPSIPPRSHEVASYLLARRVTFETKKEGSILDSRLVFALDSEQDWITHCHNAVGLHVSFASHLSGFFAVLSRRLLKQNNRWKRRPSQPKLP